MLDKYSSARLKVDRAKQHIRALQDAISSIPEDRYVLGVELDFERGKSRVEFRTEHIDPIISLIFGDAVTNLRSALDHCYAAAVGKSHASRGQVFFPIRDNRNSLIQSIDKRAEKSPVPEALKALLADEIKPYDDGGNRNICGLNKLANIDKHRLLLAISALAGISVSYSHGEVTITNGFFACEAGEKYVISTGPGPIEFKSKPKPTLSVMIGEREPSLFYGKPAVPALLGFVADVTAVIDRIAVTIP